jgi:hypothetical protein
MLGAMWPACLAAVGLMLAPPESKSPRAPDEFSQTDRPQPPIGRLSSWLGGAVATGLSARVLDEPGTHRPDGGQLAAATIVGGVHGRLAGYAERKAGGSRAQLMLTPELDLQLELGGTTAWRDDIAVQQGLRARSGVAAGISGVTTLGVAWASPGRVGVFAGIDAGQRFLARTNSDLDGPYYLASVGPTFGLRVALHRELTMLIGGGLDGNVGAQRFDNRTHLVAQLAPVIDLELFAQPRRDLYFGFLARGDLTALGTQLGGRRLHGRTTAEFGWELRGKRLSYAAILLTYDGTRIDGEPGHPQLAAIGERRVGHQLVLGGGISF